VFVFVLVLVLVFVLVFVLVPAARRSHPSRQPRQVASASATMSRRLIATVYLHFCTAPMWYMLRPMDNLKIMILVSGAALFLGSFGLLAYHYVMLTGQLMRLAAL